MILFKKVKGPYGWFSNMSPHPVDGYKTAEALFQASRFPDDPVIQQMIRECPSPMGAKMIAKKYVECMVIKPRSAEDLKLMRKVVRHKIEQHPDLRAELLKTGDEVIVEDVSARPNESGLFWGAMPTVNGLQGENWLGKIWMELRTELRAPPAEEPRPMWKPIPKPGR